jgi:fructose-1-phosphate kinase PfkB-like protein
MGWGLEESLRFATAAASLKVTRPGLQMFPIAEIKELAAQLPVERPALVDRDGR